MRGPRGAEATSSRRCIPSLHGNPAGTLSRRDTGTLLAKDALPGYRQAFLYYWRGLLAFLNLILIARIRLSLIDLEDVSKPCFAEFSHLESKHNSSFYHCLRLLL